MKKVITVILAAALLFCSCGQKTADESKDVRISSNWLNLNLNGEFYVVNENMTNRLYFIDFDTMKSAAVCSRPNCTHDVSDVCTALGMDNHPIIIGDKLYFFESETVWTNEHKILENTNIYCAEKDGSGRKKIDTLENLRIYQFDYVVIIGSTIYFAGTEIGIKEDNTASSGYNKHYMCSYDFAAKKFENYGLLCEGYGSGATVFGEYDGGLYIGSSYTDEQIDIFADDWYEVFKEHLKEQLWRFDLKTGEISPSELPTPDFVDGGFYGYNEDDKAVVLNAKGKVTKYDDFRFSGEIGYPAINGTVFNMTDGTALNIEKSEVLKLNTDKIPEGFTVIAYRNGNYIGHTYQEDSANKIYNKIYTLIPENEMFSDETKPENDTAQDTSPAVEDTNTETEEETIKWGDTNSPLAKEYWSMSQEERVAKDHEDCLKYKELLGITSRKDANQLGYTFAGDYYLTTYCIGDLHSVGYVIDTNYSEACKIEIKATEINLDTGAEKALEASADGNMGAHLAVFADDGFIIKSYTITSDFSSRPEKIEVEYIDSWIENELFLDKLDSMSPEEQDAYLEEIYKQKLEELYNEGGE